MNIAWLISTYQKLDNILYLINTIYQEGDIVLIHHDKNSPKEDVAYLKEHLKHLPQTFVYQKYKTYWGSPNIINADVFLGKQLIKKKLPYDYVINLTGTTFPIKPLQELRLFLSKEYPKSFIESTPINFLDINSKILRTIEFTNSHFRNINWNFVDTLIEKNKPINFLLKLHRLYIKFWTKFRRRFCSSSRLLLSFPKAYRGFVHTMISKEHYQKIFSSPRLPLFIFELQTIGNADEVIFHTLLRNIISEQEIINSNYLYTRWTTNIGSPDDLTELDIPELSQIDYFFARKFEDIQVIQKIKNQLCSDSSINK